MELMNDKVDGSGGAQGTLPATQWNQPASEIQNVITDTGQTLSAGDLDQLGKGIATYVANGDFYTDSGSVNSYVLTVIGNNQRLTGYVDGAKFYFVPDNNNTGASTINVGGLGSKNFKDSIGDVLIGAELTAGEIACGYYDVGTDEVRQIPLLTRANMIDMKSGRKNFLPDGAFNFWPEGVTFSIVGYTAATWFSSNANLTVTREDSPFTGSAFALQCSAAGGVAPQIETFVELEKQAEIAPFMANKEYTVSFDINDVAAAADISLIVELVDDSAGAGAVTVLSSTVIGTTISGSQRVSHTFNFGNPTPGASNVALRLSVLLSTTNSVFIIDNVQMEEGAFATDYEYRSLAEEQSHVDRYIETILGADGVVVSTGQAVTTSAVFGVIKYNNEKRVTPTITYGSNYDCARAAGAQANCTISTDSTSLKQLTWQGQSGTGLVAGDASLLKVFGTSNFDIIIDARF